jgi:hypothetical protein
MFDRNDLEELERAWVLPADATPLQRALAYTPHCAAAGRYQNRIIADLCRALGILPPWAQTKGDASNPR